MLLNDATLANEYATPIAVKIVTDGNSYRKAFIKTHVVYCLQKMDIPRDFFRGFFGFPGLHPRHPVYDDEYDEDDGNDDYEGESNGEPQDFHDRESFHFKVITDPLEIHKFFEHQMDDMMKNFGRGFGFGSGIPGFGTGEFKEQEDDKWTMVELQAKPAVFGVISFSGGVDNRKVSKIS